jgi:ankyrin repeat protein
MSQCECSGCRSCYGRFWRSKAGRTPRCTGPGRRQVTYGTGLTEPARPVTFSFGGGGGMNEAIARACVRGDAQAVAAALRRGTNPNARHRHRTLLNWAAQEGRDAVLAVLLAGGADPNRADDDERVRPLHTAAGEGHVRLVRRLLRAGAKPNVMARGMGTPLHLAASYGRLLCVRELVRAGANVGLQDEDGKCAIEYARRYARGEVVAYLTSLGPGVKARRTRRCT